MTSVFLYLNLTLFLVPFVLAIDKKNFPFKNISSLLIPSLVVTIIFSEIGVFFASLKVWTFNPDYLLGLNYRLLPLEMYLFYFTFSFACLGIYQFLNAKFPKNDLQKYSLALSNLLMGLMIAMLFFAYTKWYTVVVVGVLFLMLLYVEYRNQLRFMYKFYRAFIVCLIPFYISFGLLCNMPVIRYNTAETIDVNVFKIPFETHLYLMGMLLLGVFIVEIFKARKLNNGAA